jgi:hypothetical protein
MPEKLDFILKVMGEKYPGYSKAVLHATFHKDSECDGWKDCVIEAEYTNALANELNHSVWLGYRMFKKRSNETEEEFKERWAKYQDKTTENLNKQ